MAQTDGSLRTFFQTHLLKYLLEFPAMMVHPKMSTRSSLPSQFLCHVPMQMVAWMTLLFLHWHLELVCSPHFLLGYLWVGFHVCVHVWMCVSANVHVCTHVQRSEADIGCPSQLPPAFLTEGLLLSLTPIKSGFFWRASLPGIRLALLPEHGDYRCLPTCLAFM